CVIIGAGIAGLAAASRLQEAGVDFVILEAGDRLGGRIHTHEPSRGQGLIRPMELGAQWLHGTEGNPLFDWCVKERIFDSSEDADGRVGLQGNKMVFVPTPFEARSPDGSKVSQRTFRRVARAWQKVICEAEEGGIDLPRKVIVHDEEGAAWGVGAAETANRFPTSLHLPHIKQRHSDEAIPASQEGHSSTMTPLVCRAGSEPVSGAPQPPEINLGAYLTQRMEGGREQREQQRGGGGEVGGQGEEEMEVEEGILGYLRRVQCVTEGCNSLEEVSLSSFGEYKELGGGNVRVPGGFSRITERLLEKVPVSRIHLNTRASQVHWDRDRGGGESSGKEGKCVGPGAGACKVMCEGEMGERLHFDCDHILVTVSLGVLKDKSALVFSPPLPLWKQRAIQRIGFGTADKVFVRCSPLNPNSSSNPSPDPDPKRIQGRGVSRLILACLESKNCFAVRSPSRCPLSEPNKHWTDSIYSMMGEGMYTCAWLSGDAARSMEAAPEVEVGQGVIDLLRQVTQDSSWELQGGADMCRQREATDVGGGGRSPSSPTVVRSSWSKSALFQGSYSFLAYGSSVQDINNLARPLHGPPAPPTPSTSPPPPHPTAHRAQPEHRPPKGGLPPRVLFAGEATHPKFYSTTHGAFASGLRAAGEVL
ncbi:unnamed protein product, partial [Discosporangium mesarthrocarpum]